MQAVRAFPAEDFRREIQRHVVVVLAGQPDIAHADFCLHRARLVDDQDAARGGRGIDARRLRELDLRPRPERARGAGERLVGFDVAYDGENRVVRPEPFPVERDEIVARQSCDGLGRACLRAAVGMEAVHEAVEHDVREELRIVVADLHPGKRLLALTFELFDRERGMLREIRDEIEPERKAVLHHDGRDGRHVGPRARAERPADRIDRARNLCRRLRRRSLIQERSRHRGDARPSVRVLGSPGADD
jgi:hypothetical protein